jgi:hypothetical protein
VDEGVAVFLFDAGTSARTVRFFGGGAGYADRNRRIMKKQIGVLVLSGALAFGMAASAWAQGGGAGGGAGGAGGGTAGTGAAGGTGVGGRGTTTAPSPNVNPSNPNTVPQSNETPVSPGSGSGITTR